MVQHSENRFGLDFQPNKGLTFHHNNILIIAIEVAE